MLAFEGMITLALDQATTYLPGSIIGAIGAGGTSDLSYRPALALGLTMAVAGLVGSAIVFERRDVTS